MSGPDPERMADALQAIKAWCAAYPEDVFPPLTDEDFARAAAALEAAGLSSDRLHAAWARHFAVGLMEIVAGGLEE